MIGTNPVPAVCDYGSAAVYRALPNADQLRAGVVPLDSLPAAWWNCMWNDTNKAINCARYALGVMINEVNTVLQQAGVCVNPDCVNQLYQAIDKMKAITGTATVAGSVKSCDTPGMVSIDQDGYMTANCVGNANNLTTNAHTIVGAINELKCVYDCCTTSLDNCLNAINNAKAPVNHASAATTYGVGSATDYGHLKISDTYDTVLQDCAGVAASQFAIACVYCAAMEHSVVLGDTAGCPLGTASAGSALTAARSDHVHPLPTVVCRAKCMAYGTIYGLNCSSCPVYLYSQCCVCNKSGGPIMVFSYRGAVRILNNSKECVGCLNMTTQGIYYPVY